MKTDKAVFLDTNILVYSHDKGSKYYPKANKIREQVAEGKLNAYISPQILNEFFSVVTNPKHVESPLDPMLALEEMEKYYRLDTLKKIVPTLQSTERLMELIREYKLKKQQVYDAYIVATMLENNVFTLYTVNDKDFKKFKMLEVVNPLD